MAALQLARDREAEDAATDDGEVALAGRLRGGAVAGPAREASRVVQQRRFVFGH